MMKKIVAVTLALLMMTLLYVPAFAAETEKEQMQSTVLFQANQIDDPNMLMLRAELGVDERSEIVKQATNVFAETDLSKEQADLYTTTQLIRRERKADGTIVEEYASVAVARSTGTGSSSDQETENSVTVYAMVNYKYEISSDLNMSFGISNTKHRAIYASSVTVNSLYLKNEIDNSYEQVASNSRTIASVTMGTWYTLSAPTSKLYPKASANLYAFTTAKLPGGNEANVRCVVYCNSL